MMKAAGPSVMIYLMHCAKQHAEPVLIFLEFSCRTPSSISYHSILHLVHG